MSARDAAGLATGGSSAARICGRRVGAWRSVAPHRVTELSTDPARCPIGRALFEHVVEGASADFSKLSWRVDRRRCLQASRAGSRPRSPSTRPSRPCLCGYSHPGSVIKTAILRPDLGHSVEIPEPASL